MQNATKNGMYFKNCLSRRSVLCCSVRIKESNWEGIGENTVPEKQKLALELNRIGKIQYHGFTWHYEDLKWRFYYNLTAHSIHMEIIKLTDWDITTVM